MIPIKSISRKLYPEFVKQAHELRIKESGTPKPKPHPVLISRTDQPAEPPQNSPRSNRRLRPWQTAGFKSLAVSKKRILIAPTGSGKTTLAVALAARDIEQGHKVIIAYPQHDIAPGFARMEIILPGNRRHSWRPQKLEDDVDVDFETKVEIIVNFLKTPRQTGSEAIICTHAALVRSYKQLVLENLDEDPWKNTSVFLDESHHLAFERSKASEKYELNKLAELVAHYHVHSSGPLTLITATWMRTEAQILPPDAIKKFTRYEYPIEDYLKSLQYLREVRIRFTVGDQLGALESIIKEDPNRKTLIYLQTGESVPAKFFSLGECRKVVERFVPASKTVDLVDPVKRRQRQIALFNAIQDQIFQKDLYDSRGEVVDLDKLPNSTPTVIYNLYKFCEGADWPEASRAIMLAPRGSIRMTLQILGRLLRDWPGKDNVQLDIIIPWDTKMEKPDPRKILDYLKVILASMIVDWQFHRQELLDLIPTGKRGDSLRRFVDNPENAAVVSERLVDFMTSPEDRNLSLHVFAKELTSHLVEKGLLQGRRINGQQNPDPAMEKFFECLAERPWKKLLQVSAEASDISYEPRMVKLSPDGLFNLAQYLASFFGTDLNELRASLMKCKHQLSIAQIRADVIDFAKSHEGRKPKSNSGRVGTTDYNWSAVNNSLRKKGSNLSQLCGEMRWLFTKVDMSRREPAEDLKVFHVPVLRREPAVRNWWILPRRSQ